MFICLDEGEELRDSLFLRDVFKDTLFASIEGYAVSSGSYIAVIGVRHLTGAVDDTAHDGDFQSTSLRLSP